MWMDKGGLELAPGVAVGKGGKRKKEICFMTEPPAGMSRREVQPIGGSSCFAQGSA